MDGDSPLDLPKVRLNLLLELVSLLAFPTLVDNAAVFANKVLSMLLCVLCLVVFCLVHEGSDKMGKMRNNDALFMELTLRLWLCCKNQVFMQHIVLLCVTSLKRINVLLGFLISGRDLERYVNRGPIRMSSNESALQQDSKSATLLS